MQKWEYTRTLVESKQGRQARVWVTSYREQEMPIDDALRSFGADGWELVSAVVETNAIDRTVPHWLYFKRPTV